MRAAGIVAVACLASCGGEIVDVGPDPSALPPTLASPRVDDAGTIGDANGTSDASTKCAAFVSTTPADAKTKVGVFDDVTLDFCSALDPATVTSLHVELLAPHATVGRKAVVVSYDAPKRRIVLHPTLPMNADATYRVRATGLKTAGGTPIADVAFSFHTVRSPVVRAYGPIGGVKQSQVSTLDSEGRIARVLVFTPGPDGVPGTADDVDTRYGYTFIYSATGYTQVTSSAGPDGIFDTPDDVVYGVVGREDSELAPYSAWTARTAGPDGKLLTADDGYINCGRQFFTDDGRRGRIEWFTDAGADGIPFTDDDPVMNYSSLDDTVAGQLRELWYRKPGLDGQWQTPDDIATSLILYTVDELGRPQLEVRRSPGADGVFFSADDETYQVFTRAYDAGGLLTEYRAYVRPGPDGIWLTADDEPWFAATYSYDPAGNLTSSEMSGVHFEYAPQL